METKSFKLISAESSINWTGRKVTGAHNGTIHLKEGTLILNNDQLTGGNFVIDTTSIKILDISDPATNAQFAGHLFSPDFFAVEQFPEAAFVITRIEEIKDADHLITGNLTIKGIMHSLSFPAEVHITPGQITASGRIFVDRTKYDMKFRSGNFFTNLGDTLIYNEFELDVTLIAKATI